MILNYHPSNAVYGLNAGIWLLRENEDYGITQVDLYVPKTKFILPITSDTTIEELVEKAFVAALITKSEKVFKAIEEDVIKMKEKDCADCDKTDCPSHPKWKLQNPCNSCKKHIVQGIQILNRN